jgi:hypothetical protein
MQVCRASIKTVPIDDYVLDVLMRDIVGHDQQPAAFLVYLYLSGRAARQRWRPVNASLRMLADEKPDFPKAQCKAPWRRCSFASW